MDIYNTVCSYHNLRNNDILCLFTPEDNFTLKKLYRVSRHTSSAVWIYPFEPGQVIGHITCGGFVEYNDTKAIHLERRLLKAQYLGRKVDVPYREYTTLYVHDNWTVYPIVVQQDEDEDEEKVFVPEQPPNA